MGTRRLCQGQQLPGLDPRHCRFLVRLRSTYCFSIHFLLELYYKHSLKCFHFGKSFDTFSPLGPVLATTTAIPDPQVLQVKSTIDGETMQDSNTDDMVFSVKRIIAFLSQGTTLLPG